MYHKCRVDGAGARIASAYWINLCRKRAVTLTKGDGLMSEENKAVIRRLIEEVWHRRRLDAADELFAPEAIVYESGKPLPGVGSAVIKGAMGAVWAAFPDISTTVDDMIAAEDRVVVRWRAVGTHQGVMQGIAQPIGKLHKTAS
jgi:predicted ester cyclase